MPTLFTMNADIKDFVAPAAVAYHGLQVHFDLNIGPGQFMHDSSTPRVSLLATERATGYIRSDGRMYDTAAVQSAPYDLLDPGSLGVRLVANDPALNLANDVTYAVSFGTRIDGRRLATPFASFNTTAVPSVDTSANLASFTPGPGQTVVGIPALSVVDNLSDATAVGKALVRAADAATARTAIGAAGTADITTAVNGLAQGLVPTAVKSAAYTAVAGDFVPIDTTTAAVVITLPTEPPDRTRVGGKVVLGAVAGGFLVNQASFVTGGSDVINKTGGGTTLTVETLNQGFTLQYKASGGIWYVQAGDLSVPQVVAAASATARIPPSVAIIDRRTPRALPEVFSVFADKPDGAAPTVFDSGQTVVSNGGPGTNPQAIVLNGLLTSKPTNHGAAAFYYVGHSDNGNITRIGSRFRFHPNELGPGSPSRNGNVCIAILKNNDWSSGPPTMALHYVLTPDAWSIGVYKGADVGGGGFVVLGSQSFYPALKIDGTTEYEAEAWLDGNTCTFRTPDGGQFTLTDSRFASYIGSYFFHENQAQVADTDNRESFTHIWASTGRQYIPNQQKPTWQQAKESPSASTVTLPTAYTPVNVPGLAAVDGNDYITVPPSGRVKVRYNCWVSRPTAATLLAGLAWSGGGIRADQVGHTTEGVVQNRVYCELIVPDLTPGQIFTCNPVIFSSATDTQIIVDPTNNIRALMTMEPL